LLKKYILEFVNNEKLTNEYLIGFDDKEKLNEYIFNKLVKDSDYYINANFMQLAGIVKNSEIKKINNDGTISILPSPFSIEDLSNIIFSYWGKNSLWQINYSLHIDDEDQMIDIVGAYDNNDRMQA